MNRQSVCIHLFPADFRWGLVIGAALATAIFLTPVMWQMWVVSGSGNANFYFAATLTYSVAQVMILLSFDKSVNDVGHFWP